MTDGSFDGEHTMRFERRLAHPPERVWSAITDPAELEHWLGRVEGEVAAGESVVVTWLNSDDEGATAVMTAAVTACEPPRTLELTGDIHGTLRFELEPDGAGTRLRFSVDMARESIDEVTLFLAGWHIHLDHLESALDGDRVDWERWDEVHRPRWDEHHSRYVAAAEASERQPGRQRRP